MNKNILIITALPFRTQGNQSLLRFTNMFLSRGYNVTLCSTGSDARGENVYTHPNLNFVRVPTLAKLTKGTWRLSSKDVSNNEGESTNRPVNHYELMKSYDILPPFGSHTKKVMYRKWGSFIQKILDNILCFIYVMLFVFKSASRSTTIIGYESGKALSAKWLSVLLGKIYINKYQGTILKAANRNVADAKKYYPAAYYGMTKSDLCLMVNDGTDGEFYAKLKNCSKITYEPHGVGTKEYEKIISPPDIILDNHDKFILLNNASGSRWKRPDRILRALSKIPQKSLDNILLICTYFADDREQLIEYAATLGISKNVVFLNRINHIESNALVQYCDILIMTNDMSNLGNPVLEAIYYGTPIISLDDRSLDGFVSHGSDCYLVPVRADMDEVMASRIEHLYLNKTAYKKMKNNMASNCSVHTMEHQQEKEFQFILDVLEGK